MSTQLLEITPALPALEGVAMELDDCSFPNLAELVLTDDPNRAFKDVNYATTQRVTNMIGLATNPDPNITGYNNKSISASVLSAGTDPLQHYALFGWQEGRDPSGAFDTLGYLAANADVAAAHVDPLTQFLQSGIYEGRDPHGDGVFH